MTTRRTLSLLFTVALLLAGCRGELQQHPGNLELSIALDGAGLEVIQMAEVGEIPNPPADGETVDFTFHPADGSAPVRGSVDDTRILRSEFDRSGLPDPRHVVAPYGLIDVRIPVAEGRLELTATDGSSLGVLDVDPDAPLTSRQALLNSSDVLGDPVPVLAHGPSSQKADILFLPEGYQEHELPEFHALVDTIVGRLSDVRGYRDHWTGFNVWRQDVRSRNTGTGSNGRPLGTAFDTAQGIGGLSRCVYFATPAGEQAARRLADAAGADATVVLVNSLEGNGCAKDGMVVASRPRRVADLVAHELGHALFGLADEYETTRSDGSCSIGPNVWFRADESLPWADMLTTDVLPTPGNASFGTIGAFEGGGYCSRGRYRPAHNCLMRNSSAGMCAVCMREVERTMASLAPSSGPAVAGATMSRVKVSNYTGGELWVRCDGPASTACSDWQYADPYDIVEVMAPGGRLVLNGGAPATPFDYARVVAPDDSVLVYANLSNPFERAPDPLGTGTNTPPATLARPAGLSPAHDAVVAETRFELSWQSVPEAVTYRVILEESSGAGWRSIDQRQTQGTNVLVDVADANARYRWHVTACSVATCARSVDATFEYRAPRQPEVVVESSEPPATPQNLRPAHESHVPRGQQRLTWDADGTADAYEVRVLVADAVTSEWVTHVEATDLTSPEFTVELDAANTWYTWTVRACRDAVGCSAWQEHSLLLALP